jgi:zinc-binding alcohol dehydrogenase/oxidoreductase
MKALVSHGADETVRYEDCPDPAPGPAEVVVRLKAAALNHRDVYITQGKYPGIRYPLILGSDGAGECEGQAVIINPALDWGKDARAQSKGFHILGGPRAGVFAEKVAVPRDRLHEKPAHLDWAEAAALPLGGLTAYRALFTRGGLRAGERVFITGIGGGVALIALRFALAIGAEVWVSSGNTEKLEKARTLGAAGVNYREADWPEQLRRAAGEFDLIVDSAGGPGFAALPKLCRPGGRIVTYGGALGEIPRLSPHVIFWRQLSILGSTMGTDEDFRAMLELVIDYRIKPPLDSVRPLSEGAAAFERMARGEQFGKIVLSPLE